MARTFECPKCGEDISESYQEAEPDVGIMSAGWYCDRCEACYTDEDGPEWHEDDVPLFEICGGGEPQSKGERCAKHPESIPEMGYGLAGGGLGPYSYCPVCYAVLSKHEDSE